MSFPRDDDLFERLKSVILAAETDRKGQVRLPPERRLAEQLGVQRSTIRERLASLENLGLIRRTRGSGTFVQMPNPGFVQLYFDLAVRLGYVTVDEMEHAREMLEREIARVAASRATDEDVAELSRLCDVMIHSRDIAEGLNADYEFHRCLAYMTRNPVIVLLIDGLSSALREVVHRRRVLVRQVSEGAERTDATHIAIVDAVRAGDPEAAVSAMEQHFRVWDERASAIAARRTGGKGEAGLLDSFPTE